MRICRFEHQGAERSGIVLNETVVDLHWAAPELAERFAPGDTRTLLTLGGEALAELEAIARAAPAEARQPLGDVSLLAPIADPSKILCSWVNYLNPAMAKLPDQPVFFSKFDSAITGPTSDIILPRIAGDIVVEPEMTAIIGKRGRHIAEQDALSHVAGYTIVNDVTAFSHRLQVIVGSPGPYAMAKTFDSFAPSGPWITTRDEIADPHDLEVRQYLNGDLRTSANTSEAVFKLPKLISYLSGFFELRPGDMILTGSPPPNAGKPEFLKAGDRVRIEIEGLGHIESGVVEETA
ncbi:MULTISPECIES: fumarylacetoacetate hydrolase family protein [Sphingobium]|uniref:fumarylacetoacetate hydrolase family protein n=1 Tax=Sphingobium TaxID=165695 RepID=UPI00069B9BB9|nr:MULTISPECIES: fumarylacetoacetate hydrolase family protein [Sphingobium]